MTKAFAAACLLLILSFGCSKTETAVSEKAKGAIKENPPLLIALIPEQNIFRQMERYEPLADYLSEKIGRRIKLKVLPAYGNIVENFASAEMDGAFLGSFTYALAHTKIGAEVLARPENLNGESTYHGIIFVRKDSGISTISDMKGKRFVFVDRSTYGGYLFPRAFFRKGGLKNCRTYLKEVYYTGTHEDAIFDVLNKKADIGAAKNTVYDRLSGVDNRIEDDLRIIARSPNVPENGLSVRKDLDNEIKKRLKETLLNMHQDPAGRSVLKVFGARRFIKTTDDDYKPIYDYAKEINLNLATYDYAIEQ